MPSLRRRLTLATSALLVLQVAGAGVGFVAWWRVERASVLQLEISAQRQELLDLARAARELYVHQAHTFIERGPDHLAHLAEGQAPVDAALARLALGRGPVPLDLAPIRAPLVASNRWFAEEVVPRARSGGLDGTTSPALHRQAEAYANQAQRAVDAAIARLDEAAVAEVGRTGQATRLAWGAVGVLVVSGLGVGLAVARSLTQAVLAPIEGLLRAARALGTASEAQAPTGGDAELAELGAAFNEMVRRVRAAEARRLERERLEALGEISSAVAHELMNPLAAILGESRAVPVDAARVRAEAEHARRVVAGLLGFARPGEAAVEAVQLAALAAAAVDRAVPYADAREVGVRWLGGPSTPLSGSPTAVRQVLDNLIRNAVEASPPGAEVEVALAPGGVEVRDRGPGVPAALRPRLYEPFATTRADGTGLGLAVSQRIARALGGRIVHEDRPGGGTLARWEVGGG